MTPKTRPTVVVAGASGFIGRALEARLGKEFRLVGLTRDVARVQSRTDGYQWRRCDLFSRHQSFEALQGADYAIYLVHSLIPSARLTQGEFRDMELICADNFARGAEAHGVEHIVHLRDLRASPTSQEVEETLASRGAAVTTLRSGPVLGHGGALTTALVSLVRHWPVLLCPAWAEKSSRPTAREDVVQILGAIVGDQEFYDQSFDIGGPDLLTFREMLEETARLMSLERRFVTVGSKARRLSTLGLATFSGIAPPLARSLIEALDHGDQLTGSGPHERLGLEPTSFSSAMSLALKAYQRGAKQEPGPLVPRPDGALVSASRPRDKSRRLPRRVRSVQRLPLPGGRDALWVAKRFAHWLPSFMRPFLRVDVEENGDEEIVRFYVRGLPWPLLVLDLAHPVSTDDRQLYWIVGGLLARPDQQGRLEFREVLDSTLILAALHDFEPRLPWWLYTRTQAWVHLWVMGRFGKHLQDLASRSQDKLEDDSRD